MPHSTNEPGTIDATFNYVPRLRQGEPERLFYPSTIGFRRFKFDVHSEKVKDIRTCDEDFKVDTHGFQLCKTTPIPEEVYSDEAKFKEVAYPQVQDFLKEVTGATHVHVFSHIVRRDPHQAVLDIPAETKDEEECKLQAPAMAAHIDQSYYGAEQVLGEIPEAPKLAPKANTRWGIINVWRPLKKIAREPLAVCDARSVPDSDLQQCWVHVKRPQGVKEGEPLELALWYLQHGEGHRWYWPKEMEPDEALLIKCFDTKKDGRARRAAHSAIQTPDDHGPPRESVEVRCLVFWEDQEKE